MYKLVETFVGAGGAHLGFIREGFVSKYALDINEDSIKTLLFNNKFDKKKSIVEVKDILKSSGNEILKKINEQKGSIDVLFGGIVCKGFSLAGERSPNDERNYFYHKQIELCSEIQPKISIIENVKGIINGKVLGLHTPKEIRNKVDTLWQQLENFSGKKAFNTKKRIADKNFEDYGKEIKLEKKTLLKQLEDEKYLVPVLEDIYKLYEKIGYNVSHKVLNSAWYGAYTKRERIFIVAVRKDISIPFVFPEPEYMDSSISNSHFKNMQNYKKLKTVSDALKLIDYENKDDLDNIPMNHKPQTVERFSYIPEGKNIVSVMDKLPPKLKISKFYSRGNTMRLDRNKPSPTLVPGHSNFPVHPIENRSITVREAATITGFPLDYRFFGSHTKRCELVGNAVPVQLAQAVAKSCKVLLNQFYNHIDLI